MQSSERGALVVLRCASGSIAIDIPAFCAERVLCQAGLIQRRSISEYAMRDIIDLQVRQYVGELAALQDQDRNVEADRTVRSGIVLMAIALTLKNADASGLLSAALIDCADVEIDLQRIMLILTIRRMDRITKSSFPLTCGSFIEIIH